jgi:putative RecB family exonuclease
LEDLLVFLHNQWSKNCDSSIRIIKKEYCPEDYLKLAEKFIIDYYNRYKPFNHGKTIALEERILINLDESSN